MTLDAARHRASLSRLRLGPLAGRRQPRSRGPGMGRVARPGNPSTGGTGSPTSEGRSRDTSRIRSRWAWPGRGRRPEAGPWTRLDENPVLTPEQKDARPFGAPRSTRATCCGTTPSPSAIRSSCTTTPSSRARGSSASAWRSRGHGALVALRRRAGDRQRQGHLRRPANGAHRRPLGDVLFRRGLEAGARSTPSPLRTTSSTGRNGPATTSSPLPSPGTKPTRTSPGCSSTTASSTTDRAVGTERVIALATSKALRDVPETAR